MSRLKFSLKIRTYGIDDALMTKYFYLSKVTEFALHTSNDRAWKTLRRNNGPTGILKVQSKINQLAGVLSKNEILEQLENLQRVFLELLCLHSLVIDGFIFDPHFFLCLPKGLREFRILRAMGQEWWKQFAKHPFVGLQSLFLHVETDQFFDLAEDVCSDNSFTLGLPGQYTTGDDTTDPLDSKAVKEYSRTFVLAKVPSEIMIRSDIWMDIEENVRKGLISRIKLCTKYTSCQYSMGAIQSDEDSEYIKSRLDPQRITQLEDGFLEDTLKAKQEFSGLLSKHSFVAGDWESTALDIETAAQKSLNSMRRLLKGMVPKWAEALGNLLRRGH
ncbi:hypothetical protein TWF225_000485 [Orbilia oligospora]|nr:hypothetical protein TWF225_000485 [Orbilia oligospora]